MNFKCGYWDYSISYILFSPSSPVQSLLHHPTLFQVDIRSFCNMTMMDIERTHAHIALICSVFRSRHTHTHTHTHTHKHTLFFFNVYLLVKEREQGRDREREGDRTPSRLWADSLEPNVGLKPMNHNIMTWVKVRRLTKWATQAPHTHCLLKKCLEILH